MHGEMERKSSRGNDLSYTYWSLTQSSTLENATMDVHRCATGLGFTRIKQRKVSAFQKDIQAATQKTCHWI